jgi:hypothetical protein
LGFLTPENQLRKFCVHIMSFRYFEDISNFFVVCSSVLLAVDNPLDNPQSKKQLILTKLDYTMTAIFSTEALIKIIVLGFYFNGSKSYL